MPRSQPVPDPSPRNKTQTHKPPFESETQSSTDRDRPSITGLLSLQRILSLQRTIGNQATRRLMTGESSKERSAQDAPEGIQRVVVGDGERATLLDLFVTDLGLALATFNAILLDNQQNPLKYPTMEDLRAALQSALDKQAEDNDQENENNDNVENPLELNPEAESVPLSEFIRQYGFTHVAHFVKNDNFDLINKSGKLDTPNQTGKSNFDFDEYNNENQIFLGLVNENNLAPLHQYGSLVFLFDLSLLDGRDDFFINTVFTGTYNHLTGARYGDDGEHFAQILETIAKNGGKNEVVFQSKIEFSSEPLAKIVAKGGSQGMYEAMVKYYNVYFARYKLKPTPTKGGIVFERVD